MKGKPASSKEPSIATSFRQNVLVMLWKNQIIRRRRKMELLLMLVQIFLWFGWGAGRFAFLKQHWFPPVAPKPGAQPIMFYRHTAFPQNHPIGIAADVKDLAVDRYKTIQQEEFVKMFTASSEVDGEFFSEVIHHFAAEWERAVGPQPLRFFRSSGHLQEAMRLDDRIAFGIDFGNFKVNDPEYKISISFMDTEVPVSDEAHGNEDVCRETKFAFNANEIIALNWTNPQYCSSGKYLDSGFVYVQHFLSNAIIRARVALHEKNLGLPAGGSEYLSEPFRQTLINRLELPGVTVVAEDFPLQMGLHTSYPSLAAGTPIFIMFAFSRFLISTLHDLVAEKESKLKEVMSIFGLTSSEYWYSWLLTSVAMNVLYTAVTLIICRLSYMFADSSYVLIGIIFYFYLLSLLTSGYLIGACFDSLQTASMVGMSLSLVFNCIGFALAKLTHAPLITKLASCIFSPIAFSLVIDETLRALPMRPLTFEVLISKDGQSILLYSLSLVFTSLLYWALAWYVDSLRTTGYGTSRPWYWPLVQLAKYMSGKRFTDSLDEYQVVSTTDFSDFAIGELEGFSEPVPPVLSQKGKALAIRNLVREFSVAGVTKRAVDNLNLDIYNSEIFALLGHNGAGKTTTINMLIGMVPPGGGDALVAGHSIRSNPTAVRKAISFCPQHNIFIDALLCIEMLCFFAGLRGVDVRYPLLKLQNPSVYAQELMEEHAKKSQEQQIAALQGRRIQQLQSDTLTWDGILNMVDRFGITEKLFAFPHTLSGGQKRRLWLSITMIAEPKVVFLDEPTSGVDPVGRQEIWKVIQEERQAGRCIILTTHHMEEADILADRKAVMSAGRLTCVGTSLFLKSKFGIGYYLEVQLNKHLTENEHAIHAENLTKLVKECIPEATEIVDPNKSGTWAVGSVASKVLTFALPLSAVGKFSDVLELVEKLKSAGNGKIVEDYAMSMSTLEEVFFKLGEHQDDEISGMGQNLTDLGIHGVAGASRNLGLQERQESHQSEDAANVQFVEDEEVANLAGNLLEDRFEEATHVSHWEQLWGILYLRYAQIFHNKFNFFLSAVMPVGLFLASLIIGRDRPGGIGYVFDRQMGKHDFANHDKYLNYTIPYMVDNKLSMHARSRLGEILSNLPYKDKLMPIHECMSLDNLSVMDGDACLSEMKIAMELAKANEWDLTFEPDASTKTEYLARRPLKGTAFAPGHVIQSSDYCYLFDPVPLLEKAKPTGNLLRNFIWRSSTPDIYGKWDNFYPTALYFEPTARILSDATTFMSNDIDNNEITVRYSWNPYSLHAFPSFLSGLSSALLTLNSPEGTDAPKKLSFSSQPMYKETPVFISNLTWILYSFMGMSLSYFPHQYGNEIMAEKFSKMKHNLLVMGCPVPTYWVGTFILHWAVMVVMSFFITLAIAHFVPIYWTHSMSLPVILTSLMFYSASMLAFAYFWTFVYDNGRSYALFMQITTTLLSLGPAYVVSLFFDYNLEIQGVPIRYIAGIAHRVFCFTLAPYVPMGTLMSVAMVISQADKENRVARLDEFFSLDNHVVYALFGALFQTFVYGALVIYLDRQDYICKKPSAGAVAALKRWLSTRTNVRGQVLSQPAATEGMLPAQFQITKDADVIYCEKRVKDIMTVFKAQLAAEEAGADIPRVFNSLQTPPPKRLPLILIDDLHHVFPAAVETTEPVVAVKGLSLAIDRGEVFGLLGPNGAGKSTTINLLSCDSGLYGPSAGDGYLGGVSVTQYPQTIFHHLGLVPQFDALWTDVSIMDNLYTYSKIKGMTNAQFITASNRLLDQLDLFIHKDKKISELSGGNKRRASVATAFLGDPKVVLMDEPSSGIDPAGRRKLLQMLQKESRDRAIIITTHSMEEAESLCTKVGVVVNGQLQCLNTCLSIKNNYGSGIRVEIELTADWRSSGRMPVSDRERITTWIKKNLHENTVLTEEVASRLYFTVPVGSAKLSEIFRCLHRDQELLAIKDYSVAQPTLDQVFALFARRQQNVEQSTQP